MTFIWNFLFILTAIASVVQSSTLYCLRHGESANNLETCAISKFRSLSAASLSNSSENKTDDPNRMSFDLTCHSDSVTCSSVAETLTKAIEIITSVFQFETPLVINASFIDFCDENIDCNKIKSIGQAYPSISYIMVDCTDNITRMYPQPLLKQFTDLKVKPNWAPYDINAQFNSQENWYFVNDPNPINSNQMDFLTNVLHEMIHGLGFITSWSDELYQGLSPLFDNELEAFITPVLLASTAFDHLLVDYDTPQPFWGFVEFPLDKFLNFKVKTPETITYPFTTITRKLNYFWDSNVLFRSVIDMANSWYSSNAYSHATNIYEKSVTELDVLAIVEGESIISLETSVNPYSTGSSLCHVDQMEYANSEEYLMVYVAKQGISMEQLNKLYPEGPIGPKLKKIMAALGYNLRSEKPTRPELNYWSPPKGLVRTPSNPDPSLTVDSDGPARSPLKSSGNPTLTKNVSISNRTFTPYLNNFVFLLPLFLRFL